MADRVSLTEANIQAEFYHHCKNLGIVCVLEYSTPVGRLDAAVFSPSADSLVAIVEFKRDVTLANRQGRQVRRYARIGVPVYMAASIEEAAALALQIHLEYYGPDSQAGISVEQVSNVPRANRWRRRKGGYHFLDVDEGLNIKK